MEVSGGHFVTCILNGIIPSLGPTTLLIGLGWVALWSVAADWDSHLRVEKYTSHHGHPEHMNITGLENNLWSVHGQTPRPCSSKRTIIFSSFSKKIKSACVIMSNVQVQIYEAILKEPMILDFKGSSKFIDSKKTDWTLGSGYVILTHFLTSHV